MGVVVPAYGVERWLPECLDSLLAQTHRSWQAVVVDDGSPDRSGEVAARYAARDPRISVVRTANRGLGAARNEGVRHVGGDYLAFLDSDDVLPPDAYATLVERLESSGSDFAAASFDRWEDGALVEPQWMRRIHRVERTAITAEDHPEVLGDVFAWDKLFRRSFWDAAGLRWPEGVRYEDQPCTTEAFLRGRFDVVPDRVYRWRIRNDGTSITQQRSSPEDLRDRWTTKAMALATVTELGSEHLRQVFLERVLAGDLRRYFVEIPGCSDEWWDLLAGGVQQLWGEHSLVSSGLTPVHRLTGWLVEQGRRADAAAVMAYAAELGRPLPQVRDGAGARLDVPASVLDPATVDPAALALRAFEVRV